MLQQRERERGASGGGGGVQSEIERMLLKFSRELLLRGRESAPQVGGCRTRRAAATVHT